MTVVQRADVVELRVSIDALRRAAGLSAAFTNTAPPADVIAASSFLELVERLSEAMVRFGYPAFVYSPGVPHPGVGVTIHAAHVQELREAVK